MGNLAGMKKAIHASLMRCASRVHFMITALLAAQVGVSIRKTEQTGESFINMDLDSLCNLLQSLNQNMQD